MPTGTPRRLISAAASGDSLWRWSFPAGQKRTPATVLGKLAGADITEIELQDPYCMTKGNRAHLAAFLGEIIGLSGKVARIEVRAWSPDSFKIRDQSLQPESEGTAKFDFNQKLPFDKRKGARLAWNLVTRKPAGDFHDRFVRFSVAEQGKRIDYQLDLSGGIDRFMDHSRETVAILARVV